MNQTEDLKFLEVKFNSENCFFFKDYNIERFGIQFQNIYYITNITCVIKNDKPKHNVVTKYWWKLSTVEAFWGKDKLYCINQHLGLGREYV